VCFIDTYIINNTTAGGSIMDGFIYLWTNKKNNRKYLGSHVGHLNDGYIGSGKIFKRAVEKYGLHNFEREILEIIDDKSKIFEREQYYLDLYDAANDKSFYNISPRAGGGFDYINNNPELKKQNEKRFAQWFKNNEHPKGMKGKTHPNRGPADKALAEYIQTIKKPIEQWDVYGNYIRTFDSITEAAKSVNGIPSNIKYTADGKYKKAYNYTWKWVTDEREKEN